MQNAEQQTINLDTFSHRLIGSYKTRTNLLILCDATEGKFDIDMPNCEGSEHAKFNFNRKDEVAIIDGAANEITFVPITGQLMQNEATQTLVVGQSIVWVTDGLNWYAE